MEFHTECGLELLSRFREKPHAINLDKNLFSNDINNDTVIEIVGPSSTGKTLLLCQFIAKCILPVQYKEIKIEGCDLCAILIDTLGHIQMSKIAELMSSMIHSAYQTVGIEPPIGTINSIVNRSLENLTVINCCNNNQFQLTLHTLENELFMNDKIALLAIDNILAYYWQERREKGILSMASYVKDLVRVIRSCTSRFKTIMVYTRPDGPISENETSVRHNTNIEKLGINYRLQFHKTNTAREFVCQMESMNDMKQIRYTISDSGIKWIY